MTEANPLAGLNAAELAALAKAQAAGVSVVGKDGKTTNVSDLTPKAPAPAAASGDVTPSGTAPAAPAAAPAGAPAAPAAGGKPARPDNVPEKFWDAEKGTVNTEALLKSYGELEKARSKPAADPNAMPKAEGMQKPAEAQPGEAPKPAEAKPGEAPAKTPEQIQAEATAARNSAVQAATADLQSTGVLSEQTYAKLAASGYDRATVDQFVAGQKAQATLALQDIHAAAGGKEAYDTMLKWGGANYSAAEQAAFDAAIHSGNAGQAQLAVKGLVARFNADLGKQAGTRVDGQNGGGTPAANAFSSQADFVKATSDPKYAKDESYRAEVQRRVEASLRQGIDIGIRIHR